MATFHPLRSLGVLVNSRAMRPRPTQQLAKGFGALALLGLVISIPLGLIMWAAKIEHERRVDILNTGVVATAVVTKSSQVTSRGCAFQYRFQVNGSDFEGGEGGCPLVRSHPVGRSLSIRFDPQYPQHSVAVGAELWPGWAVVPPLLALPLILLGGVVAYAIIRDAFRRPKRQPAP